MRTLASGALVCALATVPGAARAAAPAHAAALQQQPAAPAAASASDTATVVRFDIVPQPLGRALAAYARQAGLHVVVDTAAVGAVWSPGVAGSRSAGDALRRLLAGTGFDARFRDDATVAVVRRGDRSTTAQALQPVVVTGATTRRASYAGTRTTTATKTDTPLRDTPQAVTVVTRDLIADQAMQTMADVVRYVPGITMGQGEGHRDAPTIRGNSSTADFFVDGVRDDAQYLRDLYNVDRVEALKGSNAMIFGRGGGGGVLNRVSKEAEWATVRSLTAEGGSFDHQRGTVDVGQGLGPAALRFNGMYERSRGFRDQAELKRFGINPTVALAAGARTVVRLGYEYFNDDRRIDRGIPSFAGRPADTPITTFFGNPDSSYGDVKVNAATALVQHQAGAGVTIRNRTRFADYDKFYQNSFSGAVNAAGTQVALSGYNQTLGRQNLINQTDVTYAAATGPVRHTLLTGVELSRQSTDTYRSTAYYNNTSTSFSAPLDDPTVSTPITFRQSATDANNHTRTTVAAVYAQDQLALTSYLQAVVGLRYERFTIDFHNNRSGDDLARDDRMVSPRAGLLLKPVQPVSFYGTYSISYLPSSGDQFSSLTATTQTLKPERFTNYEVGAKWDVSPALALTTAAYRLRRTNTSAPDPNDPSRTVQTGSQRTTGYEFGATGSLTRHWQLAAGYASQKAEIVSTTAAAPAGRSVALVPHVTASLWNKYQFSPALGVGLGVVRQARMYAAIDNTVTLPAFERADGALYLGLARNVRAQLNVENLFDRQYYWTSQGNNNIMPGASRTVRLSLTTGF